MCAGKVRGKMSKEDQILLMLSDLQADVKNMQARLEKLGGGTAEKKSPKARGMEAIRKLSKLLTKEEANDLAQAVAAQRICKGRLSARWI